jgi:hypothetical protein
VRWRPDTDVCVECGFDWTQRRADAISIVGSGPVRARQILENQENPYEGEGGRWSPSTYLWHLVDVLRIGRERFLILELDPERGIPCWDENALAAARRYEMLSCPVGLACLSVETRLWTEAARSASDTARTDHPQYGWFGALEIVRRNAHEVAHHLQDMSGRPVP